jgi:hypothetical protein
MVLLVTSDNENFTVDKEVAERSVLIKNMLEGKFPSPILCDRRLGRRPTRDTWLMSPDLPFPSQTLARATSRSLSLTCRPACSRRYASHHNILITRAFHSRSVLHLSQFAYIQVLEYCEHHKGEPMPAADENQDESRKRSTDISEWDQKFITVDQEMLFEIILAANYLDIKPLL